MHRKIIARLVASATVLLGAASVSGATSPLPSPGSAPQVKALVAASTKITSLPSNLDPALSNVSNDVTGSFLKVSQSGCSNFASPCTFGDQKSKKVIVLFGDSHALMWSLAVSPIAASLDYKVDEFWYPGCPAAELTVLNQFTDVTNTPCNTWRTNVFAAIKKLSPIAVIVSERTTNVEAPNGSEITPSQWLPALEATIAALHTTKTKVVVIGDVPEFNFPMPECLALHPTAIQLCATAESNPIPANQDLSTTEAQAAAAEHVGFINPDPWLCATPTACSPVVGTYVTYYDQTHVSATYAAYLSGVMGTALKPLL